jgi:hypothetical protein
MPLLLTYLCPNLAMSLHERHRQQANIITWLVCIASAVAYGLWLTRLPWTTIFTQVAGF